MQKVYTKIESIVGNVVTVRADGVRNGDLALVGDSYANVIKLEHNQFVSINRSAAVELRITLEAFGTEHKNEIIAALEKEGYHPKVVRANI